MISLLSTVPPQTMEQPPKLPIMAIALTTIITMAVLLVISSIHNSLVARRKDAEKAFANLDLLLKKRHSLLQKLFEAARHILTSEQETFERIAEIRALSISPDLDTDQNVELELEFAKLADRIVAAARDCPTLKDNPILQEAQKELADLAPELNIHMRNYNAAATDYNNACESFPSKTVASICSFKRRKLFPVPKKTQAAQPMPDQGTE